MAKLQKHENIIMRVVWSKVFPGQLYSIGFDYKLVQHNVADQSKSVTRNVIQSMIAAMGPGSEQQFQYNPPFPYSIALIQNGSTEDIALGLGNGYLCRIKRKKLKIEEVHADVHSN